VIGSIFFIVVREKLSVNWVEFHQVIFGILFILIVLAFPGGLVEGWARLKKIFLNTKFTKTAKETGL
jgi:ABC-type branched-subunit amino acid transport system permease subunit